MRLRKIFSHSVGTFHLAALFCSCSAVAEETLSRGQLVYVAAHTQLPFGIRGDRVFLKASLSIGNTDRKNPITIKKIDHFDSTGTRIDSYVTHPEPLKPMASTDYIVRAAPQRQGIMNSFLVEWESEIPVSPPFIEAIMASQSKEPSISLVVPSRVLEERK